MTRLEPGSAHAVGMLMKRKTGRKAERKTERRKRDGETQAQRRDREGGSEERRERRKSVCDGEREKHGKGDSDRGGGAKVRAKPRQVGCNAGLSCTRALQRELVPRWRKRAVVKILL